MHDPNPSDHIGHQQEGTSMTAITKAQFFDVSNDEVAQTADNRRVESYNQLFADARSALNTIFVAGQPDLSVGLVRLAQVNELLCMLRDGGQSASAQEDFRKGVPLELTAGTGVSNGSAPALSSGESEVIEKLKQLSGGDLSKLQKAFTDLQQGKADVEKKCDDLAEELRQCKDEIARLKQQASAKTVNAPDPALQKERDDLKQANSQLQQQNADLQGQLNEVNADLSALQAQKSPQGLDDANAMLNDIANNTKQSTFGGTKVAFDKLKPETKRRIFNNDHDDH